VEGGGSNIGTPGRGNRGDVSMAELGPALTQTSGSEEGANISSRQSGRGGVSEGGRGRGRGGQSSSRLQKRSSGNNGHGAGPSKGSRGGGGRRWNLVVSFVGG
jgi:hypothetical protein